MKQYNKKKPKQGKLFVISAPSGGGKTTITNCTITKLKSLYSISKVITYTSRLSRNNEVHGKDYYFIDRNEFLKKIKKNFFLETVEYNGEFYGSPRSIINDMIIHGKSFIIVTEREGAKVYSKLINNSVLIWIIPPSIQILKDRLVCRKTETDQEIDARIKLARDEIRQEQNNRIFKYHVVNNNLNNAISDVCKIIQDELKVNASVK